MPCIPHSHPAAFLHRFLKIFAEKEHNPLASQRRKWELMEEFAGPDWQMLCDNPQVLDRLGLAWLNRVMAGLGLLLE